MLICRDLDLFLISLAYERDPNLKKELPGNTSKRQIKRDFRISSKIRWLSFAFKDRKPKGLFLEIAAPLKGGHSQTGTGRSPARQGPCRCQEHQSSFYAGEDALRINAMSCGPLPWPQLWVQQVSHLPAPQHVQTSLCNHISVLLLALKQVRQGPLSLTPPPL